MTNFFKTLVCLTAGILLSAGAIYAQNDFDKYLKEQRETFERYKLQEQDKFNRYRDSINREYAAYLEKHWEVFKLQKEDPPIKNPVPEPPVYDATAPKPKPAKVPVIASPEPLPLLKPAKPLPPLIKPLPPAKVQPPTEPPIKPQPPSEQRPDNTVKAEFFGTAIALKKFSQYTERLTGVSEKDIASYWNALNRLPYSEWMNEIRRIKTELNLNDWGMYQLTEKLFTVYFPDGTANEQLVFTVFMLNQLGYRAKIGMNRIEVLGTEIEVLGARIEVLGVRIEAEGRL